MVMKAMKVYLIKKNYRLFKIYGKFIIKSC